MLAVLTTKDTMAGAKKQAKRHSVADLRVYSLQIRSLAARIEAVIDQARAQGFDALTIETEPSRKTGLARLTTWIEHAEKAPFTDQS